MSRHGRDFEQAKEENQACVAHGAAHLRSGSETTSAFAVGCSAGGVPGVRCAVVNDVPPPTLQSAGRVWWAGGDVRSCPQAGAVSKPFRNQAPVRRLPSSTRMRSVLFARTKMAKRPIRRCAAPMLLSFCPAGMLEEDIPEAGVNPVREG